LTTLELEQGYGAGDVEEEDVRSNHQIQTLFHLSKANCHIEIKGAT
jgi:hypothetical protein